MMDHNTYKITVEFTADYCYQIILTTRKIGKDHAYAGKLCARHCIDVANQNGWDVNQFSRDVLEVANRLVEDENTYTFH